jgi:hypothetical protein
MRHHKAIALIASLLATGCVIVPKTTESFDPDCRVATYHMELKNVEVYKLQGCQTFNCQIGVVAGAGLVAASAVVSGSIVLVGNVVYWGQHRASCTLPPSTAPSSAST